MCHGCCSGYAATQRPTKLVTWGVSQSKHTRVFPARACTERCCQAKSAEPWGRATRGAKLEDLRGDRGGTTRTPQRSLTLVKHDWTVNMSIFTMLSHLIYEEYHVKAVARRLLVSQAHPRMRAAGVMIVIWDVEAAGEPSSTQNMIGKLES